MELAATAADASRAAGDALSLIDPDQLRLVDGQIDLAAIERIEQPFLDVQTAIDELDTTPRRRGVAVAHRPASGPPRRPR